LPFNTKNLKDYVQNLAELLSKGSIVEQKSFLRSFIEGIVVNHPEVEVFYNIPIMNNKGTPSKREILPMLQTGSSGRTRTCNLVVTRALEFLPGLDYLITRSE